MRATLSLAFLFMTPFMGSSINLALPAIAKEFKIDLVILTSVFPPHERGKVLGISEASYPGLIQSMGILYSLFSLMCLGGIFTSMVRGRT